MIDLQEELPAASYALTVIAVVPLYSWMVALQLVVPAAVPLSPVDVVHFTAVTPVLSEAVPEIVMDAAVVVTIVLPGDRIASAGGVRSDGDDGDVGPVGEVGEVGDVGDVGDVGLVGDVGADEPRAPYKDCAPAMSSSVKP